MRKVSVRVGGGCSGRLVYWAYRVQGDVWSEESSQLCSSGFRFLGRKDKLGVLCYLLGLESALRNLVADMQSRGISEQHLVKFYCVNNRLYEVLSRWGNGLRDPLPVGVVNEVRRLVNKIGLLDLIRPKDASAEKQLKILAAMNFYKYVDGYLRNARIWESSEVGGYVVCQLPAESKLVPLEFFAKFLFNREAKCRRDGVIVFRECGGTRRFTKIFFYSPNGDCYVAKSFTSRDPGYRRGRIGARKSLCVSASPAEEVEEILVEVLERWRR